MKAICDVPRAGFRRSVIGATILLAVADALSTIAGIRMGLFHEANPVLGLALVHSFVGFGIVKGVLTGLWATVSWCVNRRWFTLINAGVMLGYAFVVIRSLLLLLQEVGF